MELINLNSLDSWLKSQVFKSLHFLDSFNETQKTINISNFKPAALMFLGQVFESLVGHERSQNKIYILITCNVLLPSDRSQLGMLKRVSQMIISCKPVVPLPKGTGLKGKNLKAASSSFWNRDCTCLENHLKCSFQRIENIFLFVHLTAVAQNFRKVGVGFIGPLVSYPTMRVGITGGE